MSDRRERILAALPSASPLRLPLPTSPRPALGGDFRAVFEQRLRTAEAEIVSLSRTEAVPAWLEQRFPEQTWRIAPGLRELDWSALGGRVAFDEDRSGAVSLARCGVAETGALVLTSGPETPTRLNFLPDREVVILETSRIVSHLEDAWALLRQSADFPPRVLNFVTGPSRTADIEQTIQLGAHGPCALVVLLIG